MSLSVVCRSQECSIPLSQEPSGVPWSLISGNNCSIYLRLCLRDPTNHETQMNMFDQYWRVQSKRQARKNSVSQSKKVSVWSGEKTIANEECRQPRWAHASASNILALGILVNVVSTRITYFVKELQAGAMYAQVRTRVIVGEIDSSRQKSTCRQRDRRRLRWRPWVSFRRGLCMHSTAVRRWACLWRSACIG